MCLEKLEIKLFDDKKEKYGFFILIEPFLE